MQRHDLTVLRERLAGRRVVASVSGGKDSAALSLYLTELGIAHERVFMDTGWEHPATYEYLRGDLTRALGPIQEIRGPYLMRDLVLKKKMMFPSRRRRFCTEELKIKPMQEFMRKRVDEGHDVVNAVGIRHQESTARAEMAEWEWSEGFDCETWRPLVDWSEQDVIDIHTRHGLRPNPLYLLGASRVGCWPCIYARKDEIRLVATLTPERIDELRALEAEVTAAARAKAEAKGEKLIYQRTWFQAAIPEYVEDYVRVPHYDDEGEEISAKWELRRVATYPPWPIDKAVEWSRTSRGGRQVEMFAAAGREVGCVRWGLCDTGKEGSGDGDE